MQRILQRLLKYLAYLAAGGIILLAIAVGLFRLFLPRLPAYQDDIKGWATAAVGMQVDFSGMNARWRFSGPELNFYNAELLLPGEDGGAFAADEVSIGIDLMSLLLDRKLIVDSVLVRDSAVDLRQDDTGHWRVQNIPIDTLSSRFARDGGGGTVTVIAQDFDVTYWHPPGGEPIDFVVNNVRMTRSSSRLLVDAEIDLPESMGKRLNIGIVARADAAGETRRWQTSVDSSDLNLAGWSMLQPASLPELVAGRADLSFSIEQSGRVVHNAVMDFDVEELLVADATQPFGVEGRAEFEAHEGSWLVVANNLRMHTQRGTWPETSLRLQAVLNAAGELDTLSGTAGYLHLEDLAQLRPWLPADLAGHVVNYGPSGRIEDLSLSLTGLASTERGYDVSMELLNAGVRATEQWPGVRGFSGSVRANRSGGRVEVDTPDLVLEMPRWLPEPVLLERALGTVIWRRSPDGIIVLSDNVTLENSILSSHSNVQLSLPADDSTPVIDLESRWSITDVNAARRYLPTGVIKPKLYQWLQTALVAGRIPAGTTRLSGPLDRFPFDEGEGIFRIEATLADATLRYSEQWPDVDIESLDLVVDGTRLYSEKNIASNAGNSVVDANIEIKDLREPVLTIASLSTGTLESIRQFVRRSPIANVFGGRIEDVTVSGDASFTLQLTYPIRRNEDYRFTTRIQLSDAGLRIAGLQAPVNELNGFVTITRDDIASESLFGRFLDEPVNLNVFTAGPEAAGYSVIAEVEGRLTAQSLAATFGFPVDNVMSGASAYVARINFPRGDSETPAPLYVALDSDLEGMEILLPAPLSKPAAEPRPLSGRIDFPQEGVVGTSGSLGDGVRWDIAFQRDESGWDFDRGVLALGASLPGGADVRGLHITGEIPELRLSDWLALKPPEGGRRGGLAARIRSLDVEVQDLFVLGQHFEAHRLMLDRSGNDWLVQLDGEQARGSITVPYDFASGRTLSLDMEKLVLPGSDEASGDSEINTDPRELPPLSIAAEEFAFGNRFLGQVSAEFARTPDGLVAEQIKTQDKTFTIEGSAGWVVDPSVPRGQQTWIKARLVSSDIAATMARLDSQPGIEGRDMQIDFDVSWPGGPREDFLDALDGNVTVRFGTGQLDEVEPGAGRMFGLMSVVALPRRLALDFRDVLDKGFLFDEITGTFRIDDGNAYTCDLSLKGPAADVGIVGRAGLHQKDYAQTAIVSANVGNTLPVVGAVVAGPQAAAALLIFSQIFKKPLQEMGQVYYAIEGSWDAPQVESANAARFAADGSNAGCVASQGQAQR